MSKYLLLMELDDAVKDAVLQYRNNMFINGDVNLQKYYLYVDKSGFLSEIGLQSKESVFYYEIGKG